MHCLRIGQKDLPLYFIKGHAQNYSGQIISPSTWLWNGSRWSSWWLKKFEIGYCGSPNLSYAHIQLEQATRFILSHFQEEDYLFIRDTQKKKRRNGFPFFNIPKKNESRTDIMNDDQKDYTKFYSNTYFQGIVEVIIFMVRFQGY